MQPANRSQLMSYLGATQKNVVWSWCAVNDTERKVYLSVWTDTRNKRDGEERESYLIQEPHWGVKASTGNHSAARKDQNEKLSKVFNEGYSAYGYFVVAKDLTANPREI